MSRRPGRDRRALLDVVGGEVLLIDAGADAVVGPPRRGWPPPPPHPGSRTPPPSRRSSPSGRSCCPMVIRGITEASMTRRPATPCTASRSSTTARGSCPILHVPTGWKIVVPRSRAAWASASSPSTPGPGFHSCGSKRARALAAMMRRVKRRPATATRRSASVDSIVEGDGRRPQGGGVLYPHVSAAGRLEVGDGGRDRVELVQRVAELVEGERLHVPLDVRRRPRRVAPGEGAEL